MNPGYLNIVALAFLSALLSGCGTDMNGLLEPAVQKKERVVVQSNTFCRMTSRVGPDGKRAFALDWEPADTALTASKIEELGAKYSGACGKHHLK